ncbi:MAG: ABC transporter ATP-binding protein [Chloroflexi bacterium]|nr:ABC transporter ATP-binding protein [Chloroflexota bacterium]
MSPVIHAERLVKRYGGFTAVDGVDFAVEPQECFGILGPNGAGKSSTIRMISCVSPVTSGRLLVEGRDVMLEARAIKATLGVVPQEDNLDEEISVIKNLQVYARYFDIPSAEALRRATEALALMELTEKRRAAIDTLSGGMKRRLLIARAMLNKPRIIILDEPTTGLDPHARHLVWQRLRQLRGQGATMVLTTHYMDEAANLCDRIAVMDQGRILDTGTPQQLIERHAGKEVVEVRVAPWEKEHGMTALNGKARRTVDAGDALLLVGAEGPGLEASLAGGKAEVLRRRPNLEDVFLLITGRGLK